MKKKPISKKISYYEPQYPDIVSLFFMDVSGIPLLTAKEEIELAKKIEQGRKAKRELMTDGLSISRKSEFIRAIEDGRDAYNMLITSNTRLVISVAKKYTWTGLSLLDLVQEGYIGLIKAIEKYNYQLGYRFSTYAKWWIWQAISRGISSTSRTVRLPPHLTDNIFRLSRIENELTNKFGREPTCIEICEYMGITIGVLELLKKVAQRIQSINSPLGDFSDTEFGDFIIDEVPSIEDSISESELSAVIQQGIACLPSRESTILRMLYGLNGSSKFTLTSAGRELGLSKERIRQIHEQALIHLRKWVITWGYDL